MSFSEKLQNLRKEKKYSQEQLADLLDVTRQSVSKWESGQTYPEMDKLLAICKIFNCTLDELTNDDIKEISTEKKTGFNSIIDSILDLVTKTYQMITNMSFKELIRCGVLMFIVGVILSMFNIPLNRLQYELYNVLISFGNREVASIISTLLDFLLDITYVIVWILLFVHIFKIGFLDKYEFVSKEKEFKNNEGSKENNVVNNNKIINEDKKVLETKEPNYVFFDTLGKLILFFIKIMLVFFIIPFIATFIALFGLLVLTIYFIFTGIYYFSIPILIIFGILLNYILIEFIVNIIINRKNNYRKLITIFIISLSGLGIGSGIFILDVHKTEVTNKMPMEMKRITNIHEYTYEEGMFFRYWTDIDYIVDNSLKDKIIINADSYEGLNRIDFYNQGKGYEIYSYSVDISNLMNFIDVILRGLRNNQVYNFSAYDHSKITITSSENTINNLKNNLKNYYEEQEDIRNSYNEYENRINELYEEIESLKEMNEELGEDKNILEYELEEYKNRVKSIIE